METGFRFWVSWGYPVLSFGLWCSVQEMFWDLSCSSPSWWASDLFRENWGIYMTWGIFKRSRIVNLVAIDPWGKLLKNKLKFFIKYLNCFKIFFPANIFTTKKKHFWKISKNHNFLQLQNLSTFYMFLKNIPVSFKMKK